ncbi:MAG: NAD(P)/FAD-dependent oxidoreductase [Vulcanimicrobiaceae bacterium]
MIVGGGFAGLAVAQELERASKRCDLQTTVVNRENYTLFTPMLPEVVGGAVQGRDIVQPLRVSLPRTGFELGEACEIDLAARTVTVESPLTRRRKALAYDQLILALGSTTSTFGLPGILEHTLPLKTMSDALALRNRAIGALEVAAGTRDLAERDRLLRFAIVGGGFTGVEATGELLALVGSILRYYPTIERPAVTVELIESGDRLLAHLPPQFSKLAAHALRERGVELQLGKQIASVDAQGLEFSDHSRRECATVVWSAGVEPDPFVNQLGVQLSKHGAVVVNPDFSVPGARGVWALGDCAAVPKRGGGTYAPLAQNAVREGPVLARNILAKLAGRATADFHYTSLGHMASLGDRYGIAELPGGHIIAGFPAWALWRGYYLSRLPGGYRKARVALDWTLELGFPRDTARLTLAGDGRDFEEVHATTR